MKDAFTTPAGFIGVGELQARIKLKRGVYVGTDAPLGVVDPADREELTHPAWLNFDATEEILYALKLGELTAFISDGREQLGLLFWLMDENQGIYGEAPWFYGKQQILFNAAAVTSWLKELVLNRSGKPADRRALVSPGKPGRKSNANAIRVAFQMLYPDKKPVPKWAVVTDEVNKRLLAQGHNKVDQKTIKRALSGP